MGETIDRRAEVEAIARELRRHVRWAQGRGESHAPVADPRAAELPAPAAAGAASGAAVPPAAGPPATVLPPRADGAEGRGAATPPASMPAAPAPSVVAAATAPAGPTGLAEVRATLGDCRRCKLCEGRTNLVFGVGNPDAELVFVGEGPGAEEDEQGEPFVGKAGQLLTRMIAAMGYTREQVYICNVVKCRPPGNRNPEPDEIAACEPFLQAQLAALRPKAIVALGKFAAQTLLRDPLPITRLRGTWRTYQGIPLMPTFHPAYLLRSPAEKAKAWEDLKRVMAHLGKAPPTR